MNKTRNTYFDVLKGIAIILVAYGHCLQTFYPNWTDSIMGRTIVAFHMPLFMLISGYFFYPSVLRADLKSFIKKRFIHLYLPSLMWGAFSCFLIGGGKILRQGSIEICYFVELLFTGMWYLTLVFLLQLIGSVIERFTSKHKYYIWICFYLLIYFSPGLWMIHELKYLTPFFIIGIALRQYDWSKCSLWFEILSLSIFIIIMTFYTFDMSMYKMTDHVLTAEYHKYALVRFVAGLSGSVLVIYLTTLLIKVNKAVFVIAKIGMITLPIYVLHQKFLIMNNFLNIETTNIIILLFITAIDVLLSILIYKLIRKIGILRLLLFGER